MDKKKIISVILLISLSIMSEGCWDRRELQERNFVLAVAIDIADANTKSEQDKDMQKIETFTQPHGNKRYRLSLQLLKPSSGSDGKEKGKTYVIANTGESMFEMVRDMLGQSSKSLWFEHVQAIIISENALKQAGIAEILDFFKRDSEMRSRIKIFVTSGIAKEFLEYIPLSKEAGGLYFAEILDLHTRNIHVVGARTDIGFVIQYLDNKSDLILPRIEMVDKKIKVGGAALFKQDRFVGYADEYAVAGRKLAAATEKSAVIAISCPDHPKQQVVFELFRHETKLRPHVSNDRLFFTLDINMYGNIGELQGDIQQDDTMNAAYIEKLEKAFAQEIRQNVLYAQKVFQQDMKVDPISLFSSKIKAYEPETWERIKDQWEEIYPEVPIVISVNVSIRSSGSHK